MRIINKIALSMVVFSSALAVAQNVGISVGSVTKYSGIVADQRDVRDLKSVNELLNTIESQLAQGFLEHGEVDYLDRMNTESVFSELHLSSQAAFNPSTGALRGLMGRLDFLVVIDSAEPSTARLRLIDVESGAVRAVETCNKSIFGFGKAATLDCVAPFVAHSLGAANAKRAVKSERTRQEAEAIAVAKKQAERNREKAEAEARVQQKQVAEAAREAAKMAAEHAKAQAEVDAEVAAIQPHLDDLESRLNSSNAFWDDLALQLKASGQFLRSDVQAKLESANRDDKRCQDLATNRDVNALTSCVAKFSADVDKLEALR